MDSRKYVGMDVHQASISAIMDDAGKLVMECVVETKALRRLIALRGAPLPHQAAGVPFTASFVPCVLNGDASPHGT